MNYATAANTNKDLETPLLLEKDERRDSDNSEAKMVVEIHSAIPVDGAGVAPIARSESCSNININSNGKKNNLSRKSTNIIDGRCNIVDRIYFLGFLLGVALQCWKLCEFGIILPDRFIHTAGTATATVTITAATAIATETTNGSVIDSNIPVVFAQYFFSRYWLLVLLVVPPFVVAMCQNFLRRNRRGRRCLRNTTKGGSSSTLGLYFKCARFQLGMLFGSLVLLSMVNFYSLSQTAPFLLLLVYYAICLVISFVTLCLLQTFVNQICANIAIIEIIVSYERDDEDDEEGDDEYECPHYA
jgi:hypothetical protein